MNDIYLEKALQIVHDRRILINGAAKRARELARGARPLVPMLPNDDRTYLDIALLEIADEKITLVAGYKA